MLRPVLSVTVQAEPDFEKETPMRRVLALLVLVAFLGGPAMGKGIHIFQPPSAKKMTKAPLFPGKQAGDSGQQKSGPLAGGILGRRK
jgi:hypothetical protein